MPSLQERSRNNIRAGVFVTIALLAAFATLFVLAEAWTWLEMRHEYRIRFPVSAGADGLSVGSEVRVGGVRMGQVTAVEPQLHEPDLKTIIVSIDLNRRVKLYENAVAIRVAPLLGNVAWINFPSVGGPPSAPLASGALIDAASGLGMLTTLLGPEHAADAAQIVADVRKLSALLADLPAEYRARVIPIIEKIDTIMTDTRSTVGAVREDYARWRTSVDEVLANVNSASATLDQTMTSSRDGVNEIRALIGDNRPNVDAFVQNMKDTSDDVRAVAESVRFEVMDQVEVLLDRGAEGLDAFADVGESIRAQVEIELPGLKEALADARLASQQIKLTTIELRRSPWKLLYRPTVDELQHELLYEAARSFAVAAADLKAASASMDRIVAAGADVLGPDPAAVQDVQQGLLESFERYEKAQQRLIDVLLADEPGN
jgi:ABC-type transporter Mla subunit MlaD